MPQPTPPNHTSPAPSPAKPPPIAQILLWWRMTRPGFLLLTVVACLLGTATAGACGCGLDIGLALATTALAVLCHAWGNVWNDWHDARNGADAANHHGIAPFTGGSRLIQTGVVSATETRELALALLVFLLPAGLLLAVKAGAGVLLLGAAGLLLGWAYSAPPLKLMARGWGEPVVAVVWYLVVLGADYVQRRQFFAIPAWVAADFAMLVAALLLINGFPDAASDAQVGKRTWVVRLGPARASAVYAALVMAAHLWLLWGVWLLIPPRQALWGLLSWPLSALAALWLFRHAQTPQRLKPALVLSVAAVLVHGLGLAAGFWQLARLH